MHHARLPLRRPSRGRGLAHTHKKNGKKKKRKKKGKTKATLNAQPGAQKKKKKKKEKKKAERKKGREHGDCPACPRASCGMEQNPTEGLLGMGRVHVFRVGVRCFDIGKKRRKKRRTGTGKM
jgi:hypothetical protein